MRRAVACAVLGLGVAVGVGPRSAVAADEPQPVRKGLIDDEPAYKWSAHVLDSGGWVVGLSQVAYGVDERVTLGVEAANLLVGHYNARARIRLADGPVAVSIDGGVGVATPVAVAAVLVPGFRGSATLLLVDLGAPITWSLAPGRFVTVRPWFAAAAGSGGADDDGLSVLLGRTVLTGPGASATSEVHLARRIGVAGVQDLGLDVYGGGASLRSRTAVAVLLATGPVRVNLGLRVSLDVDLQGSGAVEPSLGPAIDVWVRL